MKCKITCVIRRTSIAGTTDMDVQVYSSKEKASVIVDGKVVRDDPVMRVNGLYAHRVYLSRLRDRSYGWVGGGGGFKGGSLDF